jgi:hypothetical protein
LFGNLFLIVSAIAPLIAMTPCLMSLQVVQAIVVL